MERWPSGRWRFTANEVYRKKVPRVRIPVFPPEKQLKKIKFINNN